MTALTKKLLLVGGTGFAGSYVAKASLTRGFQPIVASRQEPLTPTDHWMPLDLTDRISVSSLIQNIRPVAVVNLAAVSDVDQAEREKDLAKLVNVNGPNNIAAVCGEHAIRFIHMSSDAVFDGTANDYTESSQTHPVNFYGQTKSEAEIAVFKTLPSATILRTSLILGYAVPDRNSFLNKILRSLQKNMPLSLPKDEIRTPIDVLTLSECILELVDLPFPGILHIGSRQSISRYDLGVQLADLLNLDRSLIKEPKEGAASPFRAPRHKKGILNIKKAETVLKTKLLDIEETLQRAIETVNF